MVCLWCGRTVGRSVGRTVTWLPNVLGWVDFLSYGAPLRARGRTAIIIYCIYYCSRMVDRQKIETNVAYNFFCSLALKDFNNHLIFTIVDKKRKNWTVLLKTAITQLYIKCHCVTDTGVKMNVWQLYLQLQV